MRLQWMAAAILSMTVFAFSQTQDISELQTKASAGDAEAQLVLGLDYANGTGVDQDDALAVKWYRAAAERGNARAEAQLGLMYRTGRGVEKDLSKAISWWRESAARGSGVARFNLGACYFNGDGVEINDRMAYAWFYLASKAGNESGRDAMQRMETEHSKDWLSLTRFQLATMLEEGKQIPADSPSAKAIYEELTQLAKEETDLRADAHIRLAQMYLDGRAIPRSVPNAQTHCEAAAKLKSRMGYSCLGVIAESGEMGPPEYKAAVRYYKEAIQLGNYDPVPRLARLYENGLGVKQDLVTALTLYLVSENSMKLPQPHRSDVLTARMNEKDISKAKKQAREWPSKMKLP